MRNQPFLLVFVLLFILPLKSTKGGEPTSDPRMVALADMEDMLNYLLPILKLEPDRRYFSFTGYSGGGKSVQEDSLLRESIVENPDQVGQFCAFAAKMVVRGKIAPTLLLDSLQKYASTHPRSSYVFYLQASVKENQNQLASAVLLVDQAIAQNNSIAEYYLKKGSLLEQLKNVASAIESYNQALRLLNKKWEIQWRKAILYTTLKQPEAAIASFTQAIQSVELYAHEAKDKEAKRRDTDSTYDSLAQSELDAEIAKAYSLRGGYFAQIGQKKNACEDWKRALQVGDQSAEDFIREYCK